MAVIMTNTEINSIYSLLPVAFAMVQLNNLLMSKIRDIIAIADFSKVYGNSDRAPNETEWCTR